MPLNASELLVVLQQDTAQPLRVRLTMALRDAIRTQQLTVGTTLPSSRVLAADLGVSRGVVVEAYGQLVAEGYLQGSRGSRTSVAWSRFEPPASPPEKTPETDRQAIDLRPGSPDLSAFPRKMWVKALKDSFASLEHAALGYGEPWGPRVVREELAGYLTRVRGAMPEPEAITLVTGATQGMSLLAQVLRGSGHTHLAVEDPSNAVQRALVGRWGLQVVDVPVDEHGVDVAALAASPARAVIVTPAHQYPTGVILSAERRQQLRAWAQAVDGLVIEDDYDAEFRYGRSPVGCLQGLAPDRVALVGSVSKTLAPALRLGWVVVPDHLREALRLAKIAADFGGGAPEQYAFARLVGSGDYDRHLRMLRRRYAERRAALISALSQWFPAGKVMGSAGGLQLMLELPEGTSEAAVVAAADRAGLLVLGLQALTGNGSGAGSRPPSLVLSYARTTPGMLEQAAKRLATVVEVDGDGADPPTDLPPGHGVAWFTS